MKYKCRKCGRKRSTGTYPALFANVHCDCGYSFRMYTADFRVFDLWRDVLGENIILSAKSTPCPVCYTWVNVGNSSHLNSDGSIVVPIVCPHCRNPLRALQEMDENRERQVEQANQAQIDELLREAQYDAELEEEMQKIEKEFQDTLLQKEREEREEKKMLRESTPQVDPRDELTNLFVNKDWLGIAHNQYYLTKHSKPFTAQKQKLIDHLNKNKDKYKSEEFASAIRNLENSIRNANVK